jgi:hypothetical protein
MPNRNAPMGVCCLAMSRNLPASAARESSLTKHDGARKRPVRYFRECCFSSVEFAAPIMNDGQMRQRL